MFKDHKHTLVTTTDELADYLIDQNVVQSKQDFKHRVTDRINEVMRLMWLQIRDKLDRKFGCFEIFGFDFMLDAQLNPYLLEVNMNPAMFLDTQTMEEMLPKLVQDCCTMAVEIHKPLAKESNSAEIL